MCGSLDGRTARGGAVASGAPRPPVPVAAGMLPDAVTNPLRLSALARPDTALSARGSDVTAPTPLRPLPKAGSRQRCPEIPVRGAGGGRA